MLCDRNKEDVTMDLARIVCVTTFRQGDSNNDIEKTRAEVFFDTACKIQEAGLSLVTLYTKTQDDILKSLERLGIILVEQHQMGMGNIRREALSVAHSRFLGAKWFCWLEPEKPDIVQFIVPMVNLMWQEQSALGIFNRTDMTSYPPEQAHYYLFCRAVATHFIGFDIDYAFGPMIMARVATRYFFEYKGEYGDKWESILIPRLRIINDGLGVSIFPINFKNDWRMTKAEIGNMIVILKRLEQFNNVVPSLITEWRRLSIG
jgi:hypothetical protein